MGSQSPLRSYPTIQHLSENGISRDTRHQGVERYHKLFSTWLSVAEQPFHFLSMSDILWTQCGVGNHLRMATLASVMHLMSKIGTVSLSRSCTVRCCKIEQRLDILCVTMLGAGFSLDCAVYVRTRSIYINTHSQLSQTHCILPCLMWHICRFLLNIRYITWIV